MPSDRLELAAIPGEGRLLHRHLVDQPVDEAAAAARIRDRAQECTRVGSRRHPAQGGAKSGLARGRPGDPRLRPDQFRDLRQGIHRIPSCGSWIRASSEAAISLGDSTAPTPRSIAAFGIP